MTPSSQKPTTADAPASREDAPDSKPAADAPAAYGASSAPAASAAPQNSDAPQLDAEEPNEAKEAGKDQKDGAPAAAEKTEEPAARAEPAEAQALPAPEILPAFEKPQAMAAQSDADAAAAAKPLPKAASFLDEGVDAVSGAAPAASLKADQEAALAATGEKPAGQAARKAEAPASPAQAAPAAAGGQAAEKATEKSEPPEKPEAAAVETPEAPPKPMLGSLPKRLFCALIALAVLAAAAAGGLYAALDWLLEKRPVPMPEGVRAVEVIIEEGDSSARAIEKMRAAGIVIEDWQLKLLLKRYPKAAANLRIGLYRFPRGLSAAAALQVFSRPPIIDQRVRIPEGATWKDAKRILAAATNLKPASAKLSEDALKAALGLADYPSIEGFIAPDTYRYGSGTSDLAILKAAVARQKRLLDRAWKTRSSNCAVKSPYELLILASIIEKETGVHGDRRLVSSVFHNRLKVKMPLQTDPTVIYGLGDDYKGRLTRRDLQRDTPYNTYKIPALPPTPISLPAAAAIDAAAHPADTRYLYFVARPDGTSEFTTNLKDHNRAVQHFIIKKRTTPFKPSAAGKRAESGPLRAR